MLRNCQFWFILKMRLRVAQPSTMKLKGTIIMKNAISIDAKIIHQNKFESKGKGFAGFDAVIAKMKAERDAAQQAKQQ